MPSSRSSTAGVEPAGHALIDARRIREAVADHPPPRRQRRADRGVEMVRARRIEQQRLRQRRNAAPSPDRGSARAPARRKASRQARASARTSRPAALSRSASSWACVDLPEPSPPSKVMNLPGGSWPSASPALSSAGPPLPSSSCYGSQRVAKHRMESSPRRIVPAGLHVLGRVERHLAHRVGRRS